MYDKKWTKKKERKTIFVYIEMNIFFVFYLEIINHDIVIKFILLWLFYGF